MGHACEIAATLGVSVTKLGADTSRLAPSALTKGRQILLNWLAQLKWTD
jgi:hypothetical protein